MKNRVLRSVIACSLLGLGQQASSQLLPGVQDALERQIEQVTGSAAERAVAQAQSQVVERTLEQVQGSTVERVLEQTSAVVDSVATDRVVQQQVEQVQNQALEQVQHVVESVQGQAANQVQQVVETVQSQTLDQVQNVVETVQSQALEQVQSVVETVQGQTLDQVQSSVGEVVQQVTEQAQAQVTQVAGQIADGVQEQASAVVPAIIAQTDADTGDAPNDAASNSVAAAVPDEAAAQTPQRQTVANTDGSAAFVEITLSPGVRAVEFEWLMVVTPEQRARLDAEAVELLAYLTANEPFALTEGELLTFTVPPDLDANDAVLDLVPENMRGLIDRNHIYDESQHTSGMGHGGAPLALPMPAVCAEPVAIGIIDSAVDAEHPAFAKRARAIHSRSFVDEELAQPAGHGTAVAGLLVGDDSKHARMHPLLPEATLYTAAVFHEQENAGQGATLMRVLEALNWLVAQEDVHVINMSLAGPANRLLEQAVTAAAAKGRVVVAAAGNEGPYGPARYPAAYHAAVGVTAVDRDSNVFRFANQGEHIDYAALGVEVPTALEDGSIGPGSGTSLAAPVIAAFLACAMAQEQTPAAALLALDKRVTDLGLPGADPVYGRGLLHP